VNTTTFTIGPGVYNILGAAGGWRTVFWSSDLTFTNTATNAGWRYLYISDSASAVDAPRELEASDFVASATAPSWSAAKQGWYNGHDRCIFAYRGIGSNNTQIYGWYHDGGDYVQNTGAVENRSAVNINEPEAVSVTLPAFCRRGNFTAMANLHGAYVVYVLQHDLGNFFPLGYGVAGTNVMFPFFDFYTTADQKITIALSDYTATNLVGLSTNGWYFPSGM